MQSQHKISRPEFLNALNRWCRGRFNPKVAFPDSTGFANVAYLYDEHHEELLELAVDLMDYLQGQLHCPVMVFVEAPDRAYDIALTCSEWIKQWTDTDGRG